MARIMSPDGKITLQSNGASIVLDTQKNEVTFKNAAGSSTKVKLTDLTASSVQFSLGLMSYEMSPNGNGTVAFKSGLASLSVSFNESGTVTSASLKFQNPALETFLYGASVSITRQSNGDYTGALRYGLALPSAIPGSEKFNERFQRSIPFDVMTTDPCKLPIVEQLVGTICQHLTNSAAYGTPNLDQQRQLDEHTRQEGGVDPTTQAGAMALAENLYPTASGGPDVYASKRTALANAILEQTSGTDEIFWAFSGTAGTLLLLGSGGTSIGFDRGLSGIKLETAADDQGAALYKFDSSMEVASAVVVGESQEYEFTGTDVTVLDGSATIIGDGNRVEFGAASNVAIEGRGNTVIAPVWDADSEGSLTVNGQPLSNGHATGGSGTWTAVLGSGQEVQYRLMDSADSTTGKKLLVTDQNGHTALVIKNFSDAGAFSEDGFLGIELDDTPKIALTSGGVQNFWEEIGASLSTLAGRASSVTEGAGTNFSVSLNRGAKEGESLVVDVTGLEAAGLKIILGDDTVVAESAIIPLLTGQTAVSFALIQEGPLNATAVGSLQLSLQGAETTTSNSWGLTVIDGGAIHSNVSGDVKAKTAIHDDPEDDPLTRGDIPIVADGGQKFDIDPLSGNLIDDGISPLAT
jgi:hypothetical protein